MDLIGSTARLLAAALLSCALLTACGESADVTPQTSSPSVTVTTALTTPAPTVTTAIPTTAAVSTTVKLPETTPTPETTETDEPITTPATSDTAKPVTTAPPVTSAPIAAATTTVKPVTTVPMTTTTPPVTTPAQPETSLPITTAPPPTETDCDREVLQHSDIKAMWLSQYDMTPIYTMDGVQRDRESYTALVRSMLDNLTSMGFNTIFLQVRPNADSMYPSDYYPMSKYVVGGYGTDAAYDPVAILVEEAHARGLSIHGWINPLRCMTVTEIASVDGRYPIRKWYDDKSLHGRYIVEYNGYYYLNPAYEEVRRLIADGVAELLDQYAFDGLHMDDYFYPTTDPSFDAEAYADYRREGGREELADFRRSRIDLLVRLLYGTVKAECDDLLYGISPACNLKTVYNVQYADLYNWCANDGYIDYICPQVYTGFAHDSLDFISICNTFNEMIGTDSVRLLIGMSLGKAYQGYDNWAGSGKYEWRDHKDILLRSLDYTDTLEHCIGVSVFCYQYFYDPLTGVAVQETAEEVANLLPLLKEISWKEEKPTE